MADDNEIFFPLHDPTALKGKKLEEVYRAIYSFKKHYSRREANTLRVSVQYEAESDLENADPNLISFNPHMLLQKKLLRDVFTYKTLANDLKSLDEYYIPDELNPFVDKPIAIPKTKQATNYQKRKMREAILEFKNIEEVEAFEIAELKKKIKIRTEAKVQIFAVVKMSDWSFQFANKYLNQVFRLAANSEQFIQDAHIDELGISQNFEVTNDSPEIEERVKDLMCSYLRKHSINNNKAADSIYNTLFTSGSLIETIFTLYPNRSLSDILKHSDSWNDLPASVGLQSTFWNNLKKYRMWLTARYFGYRVSLYFAFTNYFKDWVITPGLVGLVYFSIELYYRSNKDFDLKETPQERLYETATVLFVVFSTVWKNRFLVGWRNYEAKISAGSGQEFHEESELNIRAGFKGVAARSLADDRMNIKIEQPGRVRAFLVGLFFILMVVSSFLTSGYLLKGKRDFYKSSTWSTTQILGFIDRKSFLFDLLEFLRIKTFQRIFFVIIKKLTEWLNLKLKSSHEEFLIWTISIFQLVNNSAVLVIIFLNQTTSGSETNERGWRITQNTTCANSDCYEESSNFFLNFSLLHVFWVMGYQLIVVGIYQRLKRKIATVLLDRRRREQNNLKEEFTFQFQTKVQYIHNMSIKSVDTGIDKTAFQQDFTGALTTMFYFNMQKIYRKIDEHIDDQVSLLTPYNISTDYDQSTMLYLEQINSFSFIVLFGALFSQTFFTVWIISLVETFLNSRYLLVMSRRPIPSESKTIGVWFDVIQKISYLATIMNSVYCSIVLFVDKDLIVKFWMFIAAIISLGLIDFISVRFLSKVTSSTIIPLQRRREYLNDQIFSRNMTEKTNHRYNIVPQMSIKPHSNKKDIVEDFFDFAADIQNQKEEEKKIEDKLKSMQKIFEGHKQQLLLTDRRHWTQQLPPASGEALQEARIENPSDPSLKGVSSKKIEVKEEASINMASLSNHDNV